MLSFLMKAAIGCHSLGWNKELQRNTDRSFTLPYESLRVEVWVPNMGPWPSWGILGPLRVDIGYIVVT